MAARTKRPKPPEPAIVLSQAELRKLLGAAMVFHLKRMEYSDTIEEAMQSAKSRDQFDVANRLKHADEFLAEWRKRHR